MKHLSLITMSATKKGFKTISLIFFSILISHSLSAQEDEINTSKLGIGVSLFNLTEYTYESDYEPINSIYMTFDIGNKFRLEPTVGFAFSEDYQQYSIGLGAFGKKAISKFNILYGVRLGYVSGGTGVVAPTLGGEYYFIKNFSIGSEIQLKGLMNEGEWVVLTNSSVIVRFYF